MERTADIGTLLRGLTATVARAEAVAQRLPAESLLSAPVPGAWSANDILWHIRSTADVHGEHIERILGEDEPHWRHVSPRARMKKTNYRELPFAESLAAFAGQRAALAERLSRLDPGAWQRVAVIKVAHQAGREWRLPLRALVWGMADHEEGHCAQMEGVAAAVR